MNEFLIIHLIIGPVLLAVSFLMKIWPPKKINHIYGYRTPVSMKSQLSWDVANAYSADLLMWAGITTLGIQLVSFIFVGGSASIFISIGYYLVFIFISFFLTEEYLRKRGF